MSHPESPLDAVPESRVPDAMDLALEQLLQQESAAEVDASQLETGEAVRKTTDHLRAQLVELAYAQSAEGQAAVESSGGELMADAAKTAESLILSAVSQAPGMSADTAREVMGMAHELAAGHADSEGIGAAFTELKLVLYGTAHVEPEPQGANLPEQPKNTLVEWQGRPVQIQSLEPDPNMQDLFEDTTATLTMGPKGFWYVQIGNQEPFELESHTSEDGSLTLGRVELGGNNNISRDHFKLKPEPPLGVEVIDVSSSSTRVVQPDRYPDPQVFKKAQAAERQAFRARNVRDALASQD